MFGQTTLASILVCPGGSNGPPSECYAKPFDTNVQFSEALTQCFVESSDGNCKCATTACGGSGVPISQWNTSGILYMQNAFKDKTTFNQDLSEWDTRSTINMNFEHFVCRFFCGERYLSRASPLLFVYSIKSEQCTA